MDTALDPSLERTAADLALAVCRDRSHVVIAAYPDAERRMLTTVLARRLAGTLRLLDLRATPTARDDLSARIRHEVGALSEDHVRDRLSRLGDAGSALLLLIRDADELPVATLNWLGRLATESNRGLQLVLVVTVDQRFGDEAIPRLIGALGLGAQKIFLGAPDESVAESSPGGTPGGQHALGGRPNPSQPHRFEGVGTLKVRPLTRAGSRWHTRAIAAATLALAVVGLQRAIADPGSPAPALAMVERAAHADLASAPVQSEPPPRSHAATLPASRFSHVGQPEAADLPRPTTKPPPEERPTDNPPSPAVAAPEIAARRDDADAPQAPDSTPIDVSLNSRPWARIQIDNREVGVTPLSFQISPGTHVIRASLSDGRVLEQTIHIDEYRDRVTFP